MGKEQCSVCGKEQGHFERLLKTDDGKPICGGCKIKVIKQETNTAVGEKSIKYDGEGVKVIQIPFAFTEGAWDKVNELSLSGYRIKAVLEREMTHMSLVILEKQ